MLVHIIVSWFVSALALWVVAQIIPGIEVHGFGAALLATVIIAIVNATFWNRSEGADLPAYSVPARTFPLGGEPLPVEIGLSVSARILGSRFSIGVFRFYRADHSHQCAT